MNKTHTKHTLLGLVIILLLLFGGFSCMASEHRTLAWQGDVAFFEQEGKYGLQSADGTILHEAVFDGVGYFDATGQASFRIKERIGRIDRQGNIVVSPFTCDSIEAISTDLDPSEGTPYLLLVTWYETSEEKTMGLMTVEGEWISDVRFDFMFYGFRNGYVFIKHHKQEVYNRMDVHGNLLASTWWQSLNYSNNHIEWASIDETIIGYLDFGFRFDGSLLFAYTENTEESNITQIYDNCGKLWIENKASDVTNELSVTIFDDEVVCFKSLNWDIQNVFGDQYIGFQQDGLYGLADRKGNVVLEPQWDKPLQAFNVEKGIWLAYEPGSENMGLITNDEEPIWPYDDSWFYQDTEEMWTVQVRDSGDEKASCLVDQNAEIVAQFDSDYIVHLVEENGYYTYDNFEKDVWGFISPTGEILCEISDEYHEYREGFMRLTNGWYRIAIDRWDFWDASTGQIGYVNVNGDMILSPDWIKLNDFAPNGMARVRTKKEGLYGYIDETGEMVVDDVWHYSEDFISAGDQCVAFVRKENAQGDMIMQGYINEEGELVGEMLDLFPRHIEEQYS